MISAVPEICVGSSTTGVVAGSTVGEGATVGSGGAVSVGIGSSVGVLAGVAPPHAVRSMPSPGDPIHKYINLKSECFHLF